MTSKYNFDRYEQIKKQALVEEQFSKYFFQLEGLDAENAFDLGKNSKISPGTKSLFQTMVNQERTDQPKIDAESFDLKAFYSKKFSAREKRISKMDEPAINDEAKFGAMLNAINNMSIELGEAIRDYDSLSYKAQDCVEDSWLQFEHKKSSRTSGLKDMTVKQEKTTPNGGIEEESLSKPSDPVDGHAIDELSNIEKPSFAVDFTQKGAKFSSIIPEQVARRAFSGDDRDESRATKEISKPKKTKDSYKLDMFF